MAGAIDPDSNRDLWQFITVTGSNLLRPKELIGAELKRNKERLVKGLAFYKKPTCPAGEEVKTQRRLKGLQLECVLRISRFLALSELQSHDLYLSYLTRDYRGSRKQLQDVLSSDRLVQALVLQIRDYYYSERLYLLRCLKHLLSFWTEASHPYMVEYSDFVTEHYEPNSFIKQIEAQYVAVCEEPAPTWETRGHIMNEKQSALWLTQNLQEQCELLQIMLLYYRSKEHTADSLLNWTNRFKRQSFGRRQTNKHLLDESMEPILQRIGFLQVLLLIEGVDLEDLQEQQQPGGDTAHHVINSPVFKSLDAAFSSMGDQVPHGPLLLMWAVVHQMAPRADSPAVTRKLGNKALSLRVFEYLRTCLNVEPFCGKTLVASVSQNLVYGLLSCMLAVFEEETLGDLQGLYEVASIVLKHPYLAEDFWEKGLGEGLGSLFQTATVKFPLDFGPLMCLCTALGSASASSATELTRDLKRLPLYTERMDRSTQVDPTQDKLVWRLRHDRVPYPGLPSLVIPRGTFGQLCTLAGTEASIIQWEYEYDAWQVFLADSHHLLQQIAHGAGYVDNESILRVTHICRLVHALMSVNPTSTHDAVPELWPIVQQLFQVVERFCVLSPPPLDLLAACLQVFTGFVELRPKEVWHSLQQTGLLPFLTENFTDMVEATSGAGLNAGAYGAILAGTECPLGQYPVTLALLPLVSALVQPLHSLRREDELTAVVLYFSREIFPVFNKWRYYRINSRETIGQKCLNVFHKILNILTDDNNKPKKSGVGVRDVCVYSLLFTESGRALLDIISTGVDGIETVLAAQGSALEGAGMELIQLIRLAFSVLNRLLLLRPANAPPSPVEHSLSVQPAHRSHQHVVATIAQYIYHRHDPRLPTLATLLLKRLAMVFPMSILACLGNDAEAIRSVYLSRLQASTEDIHLKVVILELLSVCVDTQPGLIEIFLNVQVPLKSSDKQQELSLGKGSCLQTLLQLIEEKKQGGYQCPSELLCAALEFTHSLWHGRRETAMEVLRHKDGFWRSVCLSLTRDLEEPSSADHREVVAKEVKTVANIMRILAQELYSARSSNIDKRLKTILEDLSTKDRLVYWSKYLCQEMEWSAEMSVLPSGGENENSVLQLLQAWRNLLLVLATSKLETLVSVKTKNKLLQDLLTGLQSQFIGELNAVHVRLASVTSVLYFTLLRHWISDLELFSSVVEQLEVILSQTCASSETLIPSVQIGLLGALSLILQYARTSADGARGLDLGRVRLLVPVVCSLLQQSTRQLGPPSRRPAPPPATAPTPQGEGTTSRGNQADMDVKLKLQVVCINLLEELTLTLDSADLWLPVLQQHSIIPCLLLSTQTFLEAQQGLQYVHAAMLLFLTLSKQPESAESLAVNGFIQHLCLALTSLHGNGDIWHVPNQKNKGNTSSEQAPSELTWSGVYCTSLSIMSSLLSRLRYNYVEGSLNFVGAQQDRIQQCLDSVGVVISTPCLVESEESCRFLAELARYHREWRLHLPQVLNRLMPCVCQVTHRCISLLIRPRLLQHMFERRVGREEPHMLPKDKLLLTPLTRRLSQQTSTDDTDTTSNDVYMVQQRLLSLVSQCLLALKKFSPDLCEILLDQSLDLTEYEPVLALGFSTPSVEQDALPTFGTLVSCSNMCLRLLIKMDPRGSPMKGQVQDLDNFPIKRPLVMFVLENALLLIMSQALRYLKEPQLSSSDKQRLKQDLRDELNSFLVGFQRHIGHGATSPAVGPLSSPSSGSKSIFLAQEYPYLRLVDNFVKKVLR